MLLCQLPEDVEQRSLVVDEIIVQIGPAQIVLARFPVIQLAARQHPRQQMFHIHIQINHTVRDNRELEHIVQPLLRHPRTLARAMMEKM